MGMPAKDRRSCEAYRPHSGSVRAGSWEHASTVSIPRDPDSCCRSHIHGRTKKAASPCQKEGEGTKKERKGKEEKGKRRRREKPKRREIRMIPQRSQRRKAKQAQT